MPQSLNKTVSSSVVRTCSLRLASQISISRKTVCARRELVFIQAKMDGVWAMSASFWISSVCAS